MNDRKIRVRFAPSPTGPLHMGGVRTALFNYLFAKQHGGDFILRIEDTDSQRFVPGSEAYIIEALRWCGIMPDEGVEADGSIASRKSERHPHAPYRQSERKPLYRSYAEQLVAQGDAYYAFDTPEHLQSLRKEAEAKGETFIYNYKVREQLDNSLRLSAGETQARLAASDNWVIRYKIPRDTVIAMDDLIRGHIKMHSDTLDDKVLWKAHDQLPTYHLANIVDDHLMEISHVIRGEEWLPSLPLHYLLYYSFGWQDSLPVFAHLPLLLKPDGKGKLSKRDGDRLGFPVFPLEWKNPDGEIVRGYREDGYFPEAFVNMLALLGWNPGTEQELFRLDQLIESFSMDRVLKSGARFNPEKAKWFNRQYMRQKDTACLAAAYAPSLREKGIDIAPARLEQIVSLLKERATFIHDFWDLSDFFFIAPVDFDQKQKAKYWKAQSPAAMALLKADLEKVEDFGIEFLETWFRDWIDSHNLSMGLVMNSLRICIVGAPKGPGMAHILNIIGKEESLRRIDFALGVL